MELAERSTPSSSSPTGGSSSAPARIRSAVPAGARRRRAGGERERKQLVEQPPRAAVGEMRARPRTGPSCTPKRSRELAQRTREVDAVDAARPTYSTCAAHRRQARGRGGEDRDAAPGLGQQRDVAVQRQAPGDDARERLLVEARAGAAARGRARWRSSARSAPCARCRRRRAPRRRRRRRAWKSSRSARLLIGTERPARLARPSTVLTMFRSSRTRPGSSAGRSAARSRDVSSAAVTGGPRRHQAVQAHGAPRRRCGSPAIGVHRHPTP